MKSLSKKSRLNCIVFSFFALFLLRSSYCIAVFTQVDLNKTLQSKPKSTIKFKLIPALENTWGYDIYLNNNKTIHQPTIPGLPGNKGFSTKKQAASVAKLVVQKMKEGQMPPSITVAELKTLKAI